MPVRDGEATIGRAIDSVIAQTEPRWRLIVVDDGSTDRTRAVVESFDDDRIVLVDSHGVGVSAARNVGLASSDGPWVAFLDCDDEVHPDWLAALDPIGDVGLVRCGAVIVGEGRPPERRAARGTPLLAGMFMAGRSLLEAIGGYDARLRYSENTDLRMRLDDELDARDLGVGYVERPLVTIHRPSERATRYPPHVYRDSAELMLRKHSERFGENPGMEANYRAIAGYNSLVLGDRRRARAHLRRAVRLSPRRWRYGARLVQSYLPTFGSASRE